MWSCPVCEEEFSLDGTGRYGDAERTKAILHMLAHLAVEEEEL